ncbi:MAG: YidC/Oxa1 family membrane protein insertase [Clostridia bacterium]
MAFLNLFSSALVAQPTGLWESIIFAFEKVIPNYAWAIILFTLALKLVLSPLDFFNKKFARVNAKMQKIIQPELQEIQQKYGNNKELLNQKQMELYKKHNYNVVGSCGVIFANLIITFVVFLTLFTGLNKIAEFKIYEQYDQLKTAYQAELSISEEAANEAVKNEYELISNKYSWLWIKNVWQSDNPFTSSIPTFDEYNKIAKLNSAEIDIEAERVLYNKIMDPLRESVGSANGYFILVILSAGLSFLSLFFAQSSIKKSAKASEQVKNPQGKLMFVLLPLLMAYITFQFNAAFGLYIITGSLFGLATTPLLNYLVDKMEQRKIEKNAVTIEPTYSRNK